jgi:hypothetical protein
MLNELYAAGISLANAHVKMEHWHPAYTPVPKAGKGTSGKPAFFVFISPGGTIARIERVTDPSESQGLRKWEKSNGYSFPYFNIPPLWWIDFRPSGKNKTKDDEDFKRKIDENILTQDEFEQFINSRKNSAKVWEEKQIKRLTDCLRKLPKQLNLILGTPPEELEGITELIHRTAGMDGQRFYESLKTVLLKQTRENPSSIHFYFDAMFHCGDKEPSNNISILLELVDSSSNFEYPVKSLKVRDWINSRLLADEHSTNLGSAETDAFGLSSAGSDETFPDVTSAIGKIILRAMNHESPCQFRYGAIKQASCPVGAESRRSMKSALEWLIHQSRSGVTWARIGDELLLAYPSALPPNPLGLATFFGGSTGEEIDTTERFESCAQNVVQTLNGMLVKQPDLDVRVIVLKKMDNARKRVSTERRYSAKHLIQSAENWQQGCRNVPRILIKELVEKTKAVWREPFIPFPMNVIGVLNTIWARDGKPAGKIKLAGKISKFSSYDAINLILEQGPSLQMIVERAMRAITCNSIVLFLGLGQSHAQGRALESIKSSGRQAFVLPSVLGLLLFKLDIHKEDYMTAPPYLIGRLLSLADQLHYHYCQHVRKGQVPPQLMGNALMATALEEPLKALALYSNRILPYQAWARTISGDAARLPRYFLAELGKISADMKQAILPERCLDSDKAQMLIGYLASAEKSESSVSDRGNKT